MRNHKCCVVVFLIASQLARGRTIWLLARGLVNKLTLNHLYGITGNFNLVYYILFFAVQEICV